MYKILTFDGGGIRSIFQARIVERIRSELMPDFRADFYAGTSGGAIVAAALAKGLSTSEIIEFYRIECPKIFKPGNFIDQIADQWDLTGAKYSNGPLKKALEKIFEAATLGSILPRLLITSFDTNHPDGDWQGVVFHNFPAASATPELSLVDALLRSSAAPTYFPVYQNYIDGGVWGNNPSMSGLAAALNKNVGRVDHENVALLSIGTGRRPAKLKGTKKDLGKLDWLRKGVIDLGFDANIPAAHYYSSSLLGPAYYRLNVTLDREIALDDARKVEDMLLIADAVDLRPLAEWMQGFWDLKAKAPARMGVA